MFFLILYTQEGFKPDLKRVEAIKQLQPPISKQQLSSFLGVVTYLSHYMPNISYLTSDLRGVLKKDALFQWFEAQDVAFQKIKNHITEDVCLRYFDTTKDAVLQVDISHVGLGAVLLQDGMPSMCIKSSDSSHNDVYIKREKCLQIVLIFEIPPLLIWQKVCMKIRPSPSDAPPRLQGYC